MTSRPNTPEPKSKGWVKQAHRYRLHISLSPEVALAIDEEARALGLKPSALVAVIVGRHVQQQGGHHG